MINKVEAKPGLGMTYDTSLSPAPAPESQGESVAAPAEVGQVGGTSLELVSHPANQKAINHCSECNRSLVRLPFIAEIDKVMDGLLLSLGVALSHDVAQPLGDEERKCRIDRFFSAKSFKVLTQSGNRFFLACTQSNLSLAEIIEMVYGEQGA